MNYERLEFLGDAILGAVIANYLFKKIPSGDEGYLTQMRSKIVSREHLNELGKDLNLIKFVESTIPNQILETIFMEIFSKPYRGHSFRSRLFLYRKIYL